MRLNRVFEREHRYGNIYENLCEALGASSVSFKDSLQMVGAFPAGKTDILDDSHGGRPVEVTNDYHVEK